MEKYITPSRSVLLFHDFLHLKSAGKNITRLVDSLLALKKICRTVVCGMLLATLFMSSGCAGFRLPAIDPSGRGIFLPNPNFTTLAGDGPLRRLLHRNRGLNPAGAFGQPGFGQGGLGSGLANALSQHRGQLGRLLHGNNCFLLRGLHNHGGLRGFNQLANNPFGANQFGANQFGTNQFGTNQLGQRGCCLLNGCGLLRGFGQGLHNFGQGLHNSLHRRGPNAFGSNAGFASPWDRPSGGAFGARNVPPACGANGLAPAGSPCYPIRSPTASSLAATLPGSANRIGSGLSPLNSRASSGCAAMPVDRQLTGASLLNTPTCGTSQTGLASSSGNSYSRFSPGVVITQRRITRRVGEEVVLIGGMQTGTGIAQPNELMQWALSKDSVGTLLDAAIPQTRRTGLLKIFQKNSPPPTVCGTCVQSVTASQCLHLTRNSLDPRDDIYLSRGQTWVSLTSASPGISYVTLSAPQACGRRFANAVVEWVDADRAYDPTCAGPDRSQRRTEDWSTPSDDIGPPELGGEDEIRTAPRTEDRDVEVPGAGRLPADTGRPTRELPLENTPPQNVPPAGPELAIKVVECPRQSRVGQPLIYGIEVLNNSSFDVENVTVSAPNSPSLRFEGSDPRGEAIQQTVRWILPRIGAKRSGLIRAQYNPTRPGQMEFQADARAAGMRSSVTSEICRTQVIGPSVEIIGVSPANPNSPEVGQEFTHDIQVRNLLSQPQDVEIVVLNWEEGIQPITDAAAEPRTGISIQQRMGANELKQFTVPFRGLRPGTSRFQVAVQPVNSQLGSAVSSEGRVNVRESQAPPIELKIEGYDSVPAGSNSQFQLAFRNVSGQRLPPLRIGVASDVFSLADPSGRRSADPRILTWDIPASGPGESLVRDFDVSVPDAPGYSGILRTIAEGVPFESRDHQVGIGESQRSQRPIIRPTTHSVRTMRPVAEQRRDAFDAKNGLQIRIRATEMVRTNEPIDYEIVVRNLREYSFRNVQLSVRVDRGMKYIELGAPSGSRSNISQDGRLIEFSTIRELRPSDKLIYRVRAKSTRRGDVRFAGQLFATGLEDPMTTLQTVRVN